MKKKVIETIHEKNEVISNILNVIDERDDFLIVGHSSPDEDCVASMVSMGLLLKKFSKNVDVYISDTIHEHFQYLLNICTYNSIGCLNDIVEPDDGFKAVIICDTAKPSMVDLPDFGKKLMEDDSVVKIEIDHHIGGDSAYIGDKGYCLVTEATSASELVGLLALKLRNREDLIERYNIAAPLSRNLVLSILTGIVGDTNMGKFIKSKREKRYYDIFSNLYSTLLKRETTKETNFSTMDEVFSEIKSLSSDEEQCFHYFNDRKKFSSSMGTVFLSSKDMKNLSEKFESDTIISVSRSITDSLAEESGKLGLVAYDDSANSGLVQFRLRRSQKYKIFDVRKVLEIFSITNGGGHEGAIGFRLERKEIDGLDAYISDLITGIERALPEE
jgi:nanoRNase/pAp phosphatase (c-di-AMP/oligoRNAs hydrolase)